MKNWDKLTPAQVKSIAEHELKRKKIIAEVEKDWEEKGKNKRKKR